MKDNLSIVIEAAKAKGISYGQYMALYHDEYLKLTANTQETKDRKARAEIRQAIFDDPAPRYCHRCGHLITDPKRKKFCSTECYRLANSERCKSYYYAKKEGDTHA